MGIMSTGLSDAERRSGATGGGAAPRDPLTVTIREAQRLSGLSRTTLHRLAVTKKLRTAKIGKRTLIDFASLRALLTPPESTT